MSNTNSKAVTRYLSAAALELSAELCECADDLNNGATGNTDTAELIEAVSMVLDSLTETVHKYTERLERLNEQYLRCL